MVRCSKCEKSFKEHTGKSWRDGICNKCWLDTNRELTYNAPKVVVRLMSNPFDFYLDLYTLREMKTINNY